MTTIGPWTLDGEVFGSEGFGLLHATHADGRGFLVTMLPQQPGMLAAIERLAHTAAGFAPVAYAGEHGECHVIVEREPPGQPSCFAPPLSPRQARAAALELVTMIESVSPGVRGIRPELVYVEDGRLSGVAPLFMAVWARWLEHHKSRAGVFAPFPVAYLTPQELRAQPLDRRSDACAVGLLLRFWLTGAPPVQVDPDRSAMQQMVDIINGNFLFRYDGPLHDIIDAAVAGEALAQIAARLGAATTDEAVDEVRARLLAEIVARPRDDAPRLVYADWLLERGDPRGELIQVQCSQAVAHRAELAAREHQLLSQHGRRWSAYLLPDALDAVFERGFVARARAINRDALHRRRAALLAHGPLPEL